MFVKHQDKIKAADEGDVSGDDGGRGGGGDGDGGDRGGVSGVVGVRAGLSLSWLQSKAMAAVAV